jgi:hypothetical protein
LKYARKKKADINNRKPFHWCEKKSMSDHKESGVVHSALGGCDSDGWESEESEIVDPSEDFRLACSKVPDSNRFRQEDGLATPHRFLVEPLAFGQFDYAFEQIVFSDPPVDVSTTISMYSPETYHTPYCLFLYTFVFIPQTFLEQ